MKTLENEKGIDLKPCLNCQNVKGFHFCPCPGFSGEMQQEKGKYGGILITLFNCENRRMHQTPTPKIKKKVPAGLPERRSQAEA